MTGAFPLRTAAKIAWRETRSSLGRFLFVVLAVAAGVGALAGVRGFSQAFRSMLLRDARTLMAADVTARLFAVPSAEQMAALDGLAARGVDRTWITEMLTMASAGPDQNPLLVSLKAVDPAKYPYYGQVKLRPAMTLAQALTPESVVVADDLLIRLNLHVGDAVRLGNSEFRIAAVVESEPDRMTGSLNVGLRLMISREGLARTGLVQPGSRAAQRFLFKLGPAAPPVDQVRDAVKKALPEAMVVDFRRSHPIITHGLDHATVFLSLVSLIALIVGALGVGMAMHAHLQQKMDNIAVMKSMGATSGRIMRIYLLQTLMLGLAGGLLGVLAGLGVEAVFPTLIERYFQVRPGVAFSGSAAAQGIVVGILTTLLFTLPPLLAIRRVRPNVILRRAMEEERVAWRRRLVDSRAPLAAGGVILVGIGAIAAWLSDSARLGAYFVGGLVVSLIALALVAWLLLRSVRLFLRHSPWRLPTTLRQGLANLYRPGTQAQAVLVALGLGVMFTLTIYLVQNSLLADMVRAAPPGMPNVFMIGITQQQADPLMELLLKQPGMEAKPELVPSVAAKLVSVNGVPVEKMNLRGWARHFLSTRSVMWEEELPDQTKVLDGAWWKRNTKEPVVAVTEEAAQVLHIKPGSEIEMMASGRLIRAEVRAIYNVEAVRIRAANEFVFNPQALAGLPAVYYGALRMKPSDVPALQRAVYQRFPTVTVINIADALALVQQVVDQIAIVIRFLSAFAIFAGAIILASSVAGTRFRRIREVVILKTLGATRRKVSSIFSVEFLVIGGVAGLLGSLLAAAFSNVMLTRLFHAAFSFDMRATLISVVLTALLANGSGWLASFRILGQKPLEVLRDE